MIINLKELKETVIPNFRGGEKETKAHMFVDDMNKIMYGQLEPGASIGRHKHQTSSEIVYFLQGTGRVEYDEVKEVVSSGTCHYCPKGHEHSIINDGTETLIFFAVVPEQ